MKEEFEIDGKIYALELTKRESKGFLCRLNGKVVSIDGIERIDKNKIAVLTNGKPQIISLNPKATGLFDFEIDGKTSSTEIYDEKDIKRFLKSKKGGFSGNVVSSIMPGKVVKVFVKAGSKIKRGDPLLIVEAMKMENELKASKDGTIVKVNVKEGSSIEANSPLILIKDK